MSLEGGCFCGRLRYRLEGEPDDANYCHCRMCQRVAGAPVVAWGTWPADRFAWLAGTPAVLASSPRAQRLFCRDCGTHVLFREERTPQKVDVALATLDEPGRFAPTAHYWTSSAIPWCAPHDDLPRYREGSLAEHVRSKARSADSKA